MELFLVWFSLKFYSENNQQASVTWGALNIFCFKYNVYFGGYIFYCTIKCVVT